MSEELLHVSDRPTAGLLYKDAILRDLTQEARENPRIVAQVAEAGRTPDELREYVADTYHYQDDPEDFDTFRSPSITSELAGGDCDDLATLGAALALQAGYPARLVYGADSRYAGEPDWRHVWLEVLEGDTWKSWDPSRPGGPATRMPMEAVSEMMLPSDHAREGSIQRIPSVRERGMHGLRRIGQGEVTAATLAPWLLAGVILFAVTRRRR